MSPSTTKLVVFVHARLQWMGRSWLSPVFLVKPMLVVNKALFGPC
uniref:Uncharacterized protein n=1 Tax=Solanum lycopersicum TaxID=4081 RepID=K4CCW6_SOLLC